MRTGAKSNGAEEINNQNMTKVKRLPYKDLVELIERFNTTYGDIADYAKITGASYVYEVGNNNPDIELTLSKSIKDENVKNYILIKLFSDFVGDVEFDDLLATSWLNKSKNAIAFWYGRLESIGIHVDLPTNA